MTTPAPFSARSDASVAAAAPFASDRARGSANRQACSSMTTSITLAGSPARGVGVVGLDDPLHQGMAHHVFGGEAHDRHAPDPVEDRRGVD